MNLLELRTQFVKVSGRTDLVGISGSSPDYATDNGADFYINEGQRYLDLRLPGRESFRTYSDTLAADAYELAVAALRVPHTVFVDDGTTKIELTYKRHQDLLNLYDKPLSTVTSGTPCYFTVKTPTTAATATSSVTLIVMPPTDVSRTVELTGTFYTTELSGNTDTSWWSVNHPSLLLYAANYVLETDYRNTQGANDWTIAIERYLTRLDHDRAEEDSNDMLTLEG